VAYALRIRQAKTAVSANNIADQQVTIQGSMNSMVRENSCGAAE